MKPIKVFIVEDHEVVRLGVKSILEMEEEIDVVGEASSGGEAVEKIKMISPNILILDMRLPDMKGYELAEQVKKFQSETKIIIMTGFEDEQEIFSSLKVGVEGYILKDSPASDLIRAIKEVYSGKNFLAPSIAKRVVGKVFEEEPLLSERELEVLRFLSEGLKVKEIASELFISERTVKSHITSIFRKMGVSNRTQALREAMKRGYIKI